jgi:hypothetical protein
MPLNCPPGSYPGITPDGIEACAFKPYPCTPPAIAVCPTGQFESCACRVPIAAMACEVRIQYPQGDPAHPTLAPMAGYCDADGAAIATALILAWMLGAPK